MRRAHIEGIESLRRQEAGRTYRTDERRELIAKQVMEFLSAGGKIQEIDLGITGDKRAKGLRPSQHVWGHKPFKRA